MSRLPQPLVLLLWIWLAWMGLSPGLKAAEAEDEDENPEGKEMLTLDLSRGPTEIRVYPAVGTLRAVVVFGSGDGGWSWLEDTICRQFQNSGCEVMGLDFARYAETDYSEKILGHDMATIAAKGIERSGNPSIPLIYSGWSMGSVQAVAAAGWKNRPSQLSGLLLFSADGRGRYGLREADIIGFTPKGPGTFALADFDKRLKNLRVAQINGSSDFMSSSAWIRGLNSPKAFYLITGGNHGFNELDDDFNDLFPRSLNWVLGDDHAAPLPVQQLPWGLSPLWPASLLVIVLSVGFVFSRRHSPRWIAWGTGIMGMINLIESLQIQPPEVIDWIQQWMPLDAHDNSRILLLICGLCLLLLAPGLLHRKRFSWGACIGLLTVSAIVHLGRSFDWHHTLAASCLLLPLIHWRREYHATASPPTLRDGALSLAVFTGGFFLYATLGLHQINERVKGAETLTWQECLQGAASTILLQKTHLDAMEDDEVSELLRDVRRASLVAYLTVTGSLVQPMLGRRLRMATAEE